MKKIIGMFVLLFSFVIWQGCGSERQEAAKAREQAEAVAAQSAAARAEKKARIVKASAEKADERRLLAAEKARLSRTYKDATGKIVYYKAEVDPAYAGGLDALAAYLKDNLKYPAEARDRGVEGTVFVDFIVDEMGRVREVIATDVVGEDVDASLKEEAVRVVASMPEWVAGRQQGKAVDVSFSVPITFEILN